MRGLSFPRARAAIAMAVTGAFLASPALAVPAASGIAAVPAPSGPTGTLCHPNLHLDKEKLAAWLLAHYPVSTAYLSIGAHPAPLKSHKGLLVWLLKKRAAEGAAGTANAAGDADAANVDRIAAAAQRVLDGGENGLKPSVGTGPVAYFGSPEAALPVRCETADARPAPIPIPVPSAAVAGPAAAAVVAVPPAAVPAAGGATAAPSSAASATASTTVLGKFRVRGNPDQLSIDRSDTAGYASVDKATLDIANDSVAGTKTNNVLGYLGYSLLKSGFGDGGGTVEVVPYVGVKQNRVIVTTDGVNTVTTSRTAYFGVLNNFHFAHADTDNTEDLSVRPEYLMDTATGTRLLSANFTYTPVRKGQLNDLIRTDYGVSVKPILIGQSRNGTYLDRGDATVSANHADFIRAGAQAGFAIVSNNPAIPVDFTVTYTGLKAIVGAQSIHYLKAGLTYNFNQNIGLNLNYANGLLPDSGDREDKWNLGVASKF